MKCVCQGVGRDFPGGGDPGTASAITIEAEETLEKGIHYPSLRLTGDERWIECLGLRAVDKDEIGSLMGGATARHEQDREQCAGPCRGDTPPHDRGGELVTGSPPENSTRLLTVVSAILRRA